MLLNEFPWLAIRDSIQLPTTTGRTVTLDFIDIRIEDMIRDGFVSRKAVNGWCAQIPGTPTFLCDSGELSEQPAENTIQLPDQWWDYAYGLHKDQNVKAGKYPRAEQGEAPQEQLDKLVMAEELEARLHRVLCTPFYSNA